jgi:hypothetical protein
MELYLSNNCVLVYPLGHSGVCGRPTPGRIELDEAKALRVYGAFGALNEYISGARMKSRGLFSEGFAIPVWSHVMAEDTQQLAKEL